MLAPHFTERALAQLAELLDICEIGAGEALFRRGEAGDALYIVEAGRVTVSLPLESGRSVRLRSFGPGTIIGEMAVYTHAPRSADVVTDESARLRRMTLAALHALELEDPLTAQEWHRFVVKMMASRLAIADERCAQHREHACHAVVRAREARRAQATVLALRALDAAFEDCRVDVEIVDGRGPAAVHDGEHRAATGDAPHPRMRERGFIELRGTDGKVLDDERALDDGSPWKSWLKRSSTARLLASVFASVRPFVGASVAMRACERAMRVASAFDASSLPAKRCLIDASITGMLDAREQTSRLLLALAGLQHRTGT